MLRADVLAQEKRQLPVTEEFLLRFLQIGMRTAESIAPYLGLSDSHLVDAAAAQVSANNVRRISRDQLELTAQGLETVRNLAATQPVMQQLPVAFDRLTWTAAGYPERALIEKKQAEEYGYAILPASKSASIGLDDVTPAAINALLRGERLQVLRVHKVTSRKYRYLPVQLLIYGDPGRNEIELAVCIDDELSVSHSYALETVKAVASLGISIGQPAPRPVMDPESRFSEPPKMGPTPIQLVDRWSRRLRCVVSACSNMLIS